MDAVLTPHRSLSTTGFRRLLWVFVAINLVVSAFFWAHGAYPVVGFMGLDVALLWFAFRANYRSARMEERLQVAADHIHLMRCTPRGAAHWVANPAWARVSLDPTGVRIVSGGVAQRVGAFLSPQERRAFARALDAALWRARKNDHRPSTSDMA